MPILLTGATGYLGSAIAAALIRDGFDVTALVRSDESAAKVEARGMGALRGDLRDPQPFDGTIVHAAIESGAERLDVDRRFVEALAGPRFVYTSTLFVLGNVDDADESTPAHHPRADIERVVLERGGTVIRPGHIHGGDAFLFNHPIVIGEGMNRWPLVHRDDVAELYRLVVRTNARGIFHAVSEVRQAKDVFPDTKPTPLDEARRELGTFADMLALDQNVRAPRANAIGWNPTRTS